MAERKYRFVSNIMFILRPDALRLNGSVMINKSINQSPLAGAATKNQDFDVPSG